MSSCEAVVEGGPTVGLLGLHSMRVAAVARPSSVIPCQRGSPPVAGGNFEKASSESVKEAWASPSRPERRKNDPNTLASRAVASGKGASGVGEDVGGGVEVIGGGGREGEGEMIRFLPTPPKEVLTCPPFVSPDRRLLDVEDRCMGG